jgi:7-cyano-7-deazaguanine reductase
MPWTSEIAENEAVLSTMALTYESVMSEILKTLPPRMGLWNSSTRHLKAMFLGADQQPDFATLYITFYPTDTVIQLKSLKQYLHQ